MCEKGFLYLVTEVKTVKRLLALMMAITFVIMAFASCADAEIESASDSAMTTENVISTDEVIEDNIVEADDSDIEQDKVEDSTVNQEKPAFKGSESTAGLKFTLNADGLGYTLVGKGTAKSKDLVIDGHEGLPVTRIGYAAFENDKTITSVKIGDSVEYISDYAFSQCAGLTSVTMGSGVRELGVYSFRYCTALKSITVGKSVERIKYGTFYNSKNLATINLPDTLRCTEEYAFDKTAYFTTSSNWKNKLLYIGKHLIKAKSDITGKVTVATGTISIGGKAFNGCASFTEISIPDSVKAIGPMAFQNATKLTKVSIGNGVEYIGEKAFAGSGFFNATGNWKSNVLYAGNYVVAAKTALGGTCSINNGTRVIADMAFSSCTNLSSVVIPDSVLYVGEYAFLNCGRLSSVTVGASVNEIGIYAFKGCSSLNTMTFKKTSGWKAGNTSIPESKMSTNEAALTVAMIYSGSILRRK